MRDNAVLPVVFGFEGIGGGNAVLSRKGNRHEQ
jgi:hypothetical protein